MRIIGKNIRITEAMRKHAEKKVSRLAKYPTVVRIDDAHLTAEICGDEQRVALSVPGIRNDYHAESSADSYYSAVDLVVEKVKDQARRGKTVLQQKSKPTLVEIDFDGKSLKNKD